MLKSLTDHPQLLMLAGAVMLYSASRALGEVSVPRVNRHEGGAGKETEGASPEDASPEDASPGRRALGHWIPIATVVIGAVLMNQPGMAMAIIFATTVASLSLVEGCIGVMGTATDEAGQKQTAPRPVTPTIKQGEWPANMRSTTVLLLPVTVLAMLAGLGGNLAWLNAALLAAEGAMVWWVWRDPAYGRLNSEAKRYSGGSARILLMLGALLLCVAGASATIDGTVSVASSLFIAAAPTVVVSVLSPLLVAPMLLSEAHLAQRGQNWAATSTNVAFAQLNLCGLLPLAALVWRWRWGTFLYFPLETWRVDAVVLILLAAFFLPATAGKWKPGAAEGLLRVIIYVGYVLAVVSGASPGK